MLPQYLIKTTLFWFVCRVQTVIQLLNNFGAMDYYEDAVNTYNKIPFCRKKSNPDLADYVATKALDGMFCLYQRKELGIRSGHQPTFCAKVFARRNR